MSQYLPLYIVSTECLLGIIMKLQYYLFSFPCGWGFEISPERVSTSPTHVIDLFLPLYFFLRLTFHFQNVQINQTKQN